LKIARLAGVFALAATVLAGCHEDPTGLTTTSSGTGTAGGSGMATLSWQAPTTTTQGTALTDLAGYRIYYGTNSSDLTQSVQISSVGIQTYAIDNLGTGTWYFAVKAVTAAGIESALSDVVSKTIG
jgi:hypothetical protein